MSASQKTVVKGAIRKEGTLRSGPSLSGDDRALAGMNAKEKLAYARRHVRIFGSFSGFEDFISQCVDLIDATRKTRGQLAIEHAESLSLQVSNIQLAASQQSNVDEALVYRAICAGFIFANLKREVDRGKDRNGDRFSMVEYIAAMKKHEGNKSAVASELCITHQALNRWERRHLG